MSARKKVDSTRKKVHIPTPEEWAAEQLKRMPARDEKWMQEVARIYGLELSHEPVEHATNKPNTLDTGEVEDTDSAA